jgi:hypothetical protein
MHVVMTGVGTMATTGADGVMIGRGGDDSGGGNRGGEDEKDRVEGASGV